MERKNCFHTLKREQRNSEVILMPLLFRKNKSLILTLKTYRCGKGFDKINFEMAHSFLS